MAGVEQPRLGPPGEGRRGGGDRRLHPGAPGDAARPSRGARRSSGISHWCAPSRRSPA